MQLSIIRERKERKGYGQKEGESKKIEPWGIPFPFKKKVCWKSTAKWQKI